MCGIDFLNILIILRLRDRKYFEVVSVRGRVRFIIVIDFMKIIIVCWVLYVILFYLFKKKRFKRLCIYKEYVIIIINNNSGILNIFLFMFFIDVKYFY